MGVHTPGRAARKQNTRGKAHVLVSARGGHARRQAAERPPVAGGGSYQTLTPPAARGRHPRLPARGQGVPTNAPPAAPRRGLNPVAAQKQRRENGGGHAPQGPSRWRSCQRSTRVAAWGGGMGGRRGCGASAVGRRSDRRGGAASPVAAAAAAPHAPRSALAGGVAGVSSLRGSPHRDACCTRTRTPPPRVTTRHQPALRGGVRHGLAKWDGVLHA